MATVVLREGGGGRAAMVSQTHENEVMDPTSRAHKGHQKSSHQRSVPWVRFPLTTTTGYRVTGLT